jgi:hypothetical protein
MVAPAGAGTARLLVIVWNYSRWCAFETRLADTITDP